MLEPIPDRIEPGIWVAQEVVAGERLTIPIDLIVPEGFATGGGRRGARLGAHGKRAARRTLGLEAALIDNGVMTIKALDATDLREISVKVAGKTALLIAKAHKIHDRVATGRADRVGDKDASDVYRLMQTTAPAETAEIVRELLGDPIASQPTRLALQYLQELFGSRGAPGVQMAIRALRLAISEDEIAVLTTSFAGSLREALGAS